MKTRNLILTGTLFVLFAVGCQVDPNYDLSNLDKEVTLLKGATFPVPSPKALTLADIIDLEGYPYISIDNNGDYIISFALDPVQMSIEIPDDIPEGQIPTGYVPETYSFGGVPDFLSSDGQHVEPDLSEMVLNLSIQSDIPALFTVSSKLETYRKGTLQRIYLVENLQVTYGLTDYRLSEHSDGTPESIQIPELGKLLSPVPDEFRISTMDVYATADQLALLTPGSVYDLTCSTSVHAPISFSADTRFKVQIPLDAELKLDQIGLKKAVLHMNLENTIPLDFSIDLYALDDAGKRIENIKFSNPSSEIIPGRSTSSPLLTLTTQGDLRFSGLVLELAASSNPDLAGVHFNRSQAIRLSNLSLELPDGIQVKLD